MSKKQFDILKFCEEHRVSYADPSHKHWRVGWVNIECPFCSGNPGYHLGFSKEGNGFNCFRCGSHSTFEVLETLLNVSKEEVGRVWRGYIGRPVRALDRTRRALKRGKKVKLPLSTGPLSDRHRNYLKARGFNAETLEEEWGLLGTGPIGPYKFRIIAPIYHRGELVSYQGRDITDKSDLKYKACPQEEEVMDHNHTLYGIDNAIEPWIVVVEGITEVWRLGPGAVDSFGIKFKDAQVNLLRQYNTRVILFDKDEQAFEQAEKLANMLSVYEGCTYIDYISDGDPGQINDSEAYDFMEKIKRLYRMPGVRL
jgi:hypothetical protein